MIHKILMITAFPPNQKTAGQDYTRRLINDLVKRGHSVDMIYASYPEHSVELPEEVNVLRVIKPSLLNCLKRIYIHPFFSKRYELSIRKYIQSISSNYDMLYFDFSQVHLYSKYIDHPCKVLMMHDVIFQKYSRKTGFLNVEWIKIWEKKLLNGAKAIFSFSDKDVKIVKDVYDIDSASVNFYLKSDRYVYPENKEIFDKMCFYGAWNRSENIQALEYFIENVFPRLNKKREFCVIGGGMEDALRESVEAKGIKCLGFVDDPIDELASCQALIAPLHQGAGVKVKVVDALTAGTPVIGTDVAFEGLTDNKKNGLFYYADSAEEFAEVIDNWVNKDIAFKNDAASEFYERYNSNHFTDRMVEIE